MKKLITAVVFSVLCLVSHGAFAGEMVPKSMKLKGLNGGTLAASDIKGKKVVFQFFASWCQGCGPVMTKIDSMKLSGEDVLVVPVSLDESMKDAKDYFRSKNKTLKRIGKSSYLDANTQLAEALGVDALPAIVVCDESGKVIESIVGKPSKAQYEMIRKKVAH